MTIQKADPGLAPVHLLILADPSVQRIRGYLEDGSVFIGERSNMVVAVAVCKLCDDELELCNISVAVSHQEQGLGSQMLMHVFRVAERHGAKFVTVGTGNSSLRQLSFYQKAGFRISGIIPDYFIGDDPPVFENLIRCIDMIRLRYEPGA